jgi:hypothetical protein
VLLFAMAVADMWALSSAAKAVFSYRIITKP